MTLSTATFTPDGPAKAAVVLIHGMAEHKERYFPFMTYLKEMGYASIIADLRGHGKSVQSPEELGYFGPDGPQTLVQDCLDLVSEARRLWPGLKVFLFGHSMGSLIVRSFTREHDDAIDGLMVCGSPSENAAAGAGIFLTRVIQLFKGSHYRSKTVAMMLFAPYEKKFASEGMHNAWLSTNKANVQAYNNDPLCGFKFTLNGYRTLLQLLKRTYSTKGWKMAKPNLPIHFIAGGNDPCITSIGHFSKAVGSMRSHGYAQVSSKVYPGLRHEILNETGKEDVWRDAVTVFSSWL